MSESRLTERYRITGSVDTAVKARGTVVTRLNICNDFKSVEINRENKKIIYTY